jgi:hypothetical protein
LVFMAPERYFRPTSDAQHVWEDEALVLGRNIGSYEGNQALIKSWLDLCCEAHHGPRRGNVDPDREFDSMIQESYFGVIDVVDLQLTALPQCEVVGGEVTPDCTSPTSGHFEFYTAGADLTLSHLSRCNILEPRLTAW